jgi:hypothetical protein
LPAHYRYLRKLKVESLKTNNMKERKEGGTEDGEGRGGGRLGTKKR